MNRNKLPRHIAIIMDGNGRWAKRKNLPRFEGHRAGVETVRKIIKACIKENIKILTLYTFSTENWKRPEQEVNNLMQLLFEYLSTQTVSLNKNKIRLICIGRIDELPDYLRKKLKQVVAATRNNKRLTLVLALNYGGRTEILDATKKISQQVKTGKLKIDKLNEKIFSKFIYTKNLPDPDLLIRTGGEFRVSNFLLWQISYTEIYVTRKLWPDFQPKDLHNAIEAFKKRERRFGAI